MTTAPVALSFIDFARRVGVRLTPAQRVLSLVAFDGVEPSALTGTDRELADQLLGEVEHVPEVARAVVAIVAGARSGKTYLGALRLLHLALTVPLDRLAPGELAAAIVVAPDLRLARQGLRFALGAAKRTPQIARMISSEGVDRFTLVRPDRRSITIEALPATRGGSAVRGRSLVGALLDESAFFRDEAFVTNDADIFSAIAPRVMTGGQLIVCSTPWSESGLLWELYRDQHGRPRSALVAHAPTVAMQPSQAARVAAEYVRDSVNASREFGAEFLSVGAGAFFDAAAIEEARDVNRTTPLAPKLACRAFAAVDLAFASGGDHSACNVVRIEGGRIIAVDWRELRARKNQPLRPSEVVGEFAALARLHGCSSLIGDVHYAEAARETLEKLRMSFHRADAGITGKVASYRRAAAALAEGKVSLPDDPRLLQQLRDVQVRPLSGGSVQITHPRRKGAGHGDLSAALVLAVSEAAKALAHGDEREYRRPARVHVDSAAYALRDERRPSAAAGGLDSLTLVQSPNGSGATFARTRSRSDIRGGGGF